MSTLYPRLSVLPEAQRLLWPQLHPTAELGLVLYGATAVALRLGHRESVDFQFFTERTLDLAGLYAALPFLDGATVLETAVNRFTVHVRRGGDEMPVRLSFSGGTNFGRVSYPAYTSDQVLQVASMDDLMAVNLKALMQSNEANDYLDLAAMIEAKMSLAHGLAAARALFGSMFQPCQALKAMTYFKGGDLDRLSGRAIRTLVDAASKVGGDLPTVTRLCQSLASAAFGSKERPATP